MSSIPISFCSLDFETAYSPRLSVSAVGLVKYIDSKPVDEYYTLVQPPWEAIPEWSQSNSHITGIFDYQLIDQKFWPEILREMEDFCGDLPMCAHNAAFEKSCINACNKYYNLTTTLNYENMYDTYRITKDVEKLFGITLSGPGVRRLNTLCEMYGCPMEGTHHNALDDSIAAGNLLLLFRKYLDMSPMELSKINITIPEPIIEKFRVVGTVDLAELLKI